MNYFRTKNYGSYTRKLAWEP